MAPLIIFSQWLSDSTHKELNAQGRVFVWGEHSKPTAPGVSPIYFPHPPSLICPSTKWRGSKPWLHPAVATVSLLRRSRWGLQDQEGGVCGGNHDPEAHTQLHLFHLLSEACRWALQWGRGFAVRNTAECVCHLPPVDTRPVPV